jgi:hypothetical protein
LQAQNPGFKSQSRREEREERGKREGKREEGIDNRAGIWLSGSILCTKKRKKKRERETSYMEILYSF